LTDLNRDGWLDIVKRELGGRVVVYESRCGNDHWIEVELEGPGENPSGVGATVRVVAGGIVQMRPILPGSTGFNSNGPAVAHFGLGDLDRVDGIEVVWPGGEVTHHPASPADARLTIRYAADP
jgi:hypothetical protein